MAATTLTGVEMTSAGASNHEQHQGPIEPLDQLPPKSNGGITKKAKDRPRTTGVQIGRTVPPIVRNGTASRLCFTHHTDEMGQGC